MGSHEQFERICWYWQHTNQHLTRYNFPVYKFERLIDNYDTFLSQINNLVYQILIKIFGKNYLVNH